MPKKYLIITLILGMIGLVSIGLNIYMYFNTPVQIQNYVQTHKDELKGDKGEKGDTGPQGFDGLDGSNGADASNNLNCHSYTLGGDVFTNCN